MKISLLNSSDGAKSVTVQRLLICPPRDEAEQQAKNSLHIVSPDLAPFLGETARELSSTVHNTTILPVSTQAVRKVQSEEPTQPDGSIRLLKDVGVGPAYKDYVPCVYLSKIVPLVDGELDVEYLKKWARLLNHLALIGLWRYGCLASCGIVPLAPPIVYDESKTTWIDAFKESAGKPITRAALFSFIFTNAWFRAYETPTQWNAWANDLIEWPSTFVNEGDIGADNWGDFPEKLLAP